MMWCSDGIVRLSCASISHVISGWDPDIDWDNSLAEVITLLLLSQQCYDGTIRTISDLPDRALEPIEVFPVNRSRLSHRPSFKRFEHFDQLCARWRSVSALTFIHTWFTMVTQSPGPGSVRSTNRVRQSSPLTWRRNKTYAQVLSGSGRNNITRNTLDCDQSNYSSRIVFPSYLLNLAKPEITLFDSPTPKFPSENQTQSKSESADPPRRFYRNLIFLRWRP